MKYAFTAMFFGTTEVLPSILTRRDFSRQRVCTQTRKCSSYISADKQEKKRLKVSWEGMPLGKDNISRKNIPCNDRILLCPPSFALHKRLRQWWWKRCLSRNEVFCGLFVCQGAESRILIFSLKLYVWLTGKYSINSPVSESKPPVNDFRPEIYG